MSNETRPDGAHKAIADGIATAVAKDGDMPLRWIAVVETMDANGRRCIWRFGAEGMAAWDALSLFEYGITKERAAITRAELEGNA